LEEVPYFIMMDIKKKHEEHEEQTRRSMELLTEEEEELEMLSTPENTEAWEKSLRGEEWIGEEEWTKKLRQEYYHPKKRTYRSV